MRLYLSYPMTKRNSRDVRLIVQAREWLEARGLDFYDPEKDEPDGKPIAWLQNYDFVEMTLSHAVLAVWGPSTHLSRGVNAELEWASRALKIPAAIWNPNGVRMHPWTLATVKCHVYRSLTDAFESVRLRALKNEQESCCPRAG